MGRGSPGPVSVRGRVAADVAARLDRRFRWPGCRGRAGRPTGSARRPTGAAARPTRPPSPPRARRCRPPRPAGCRAAPPAGSRSGSRRRSSRGPAGRRWAGSRPNRSRYIRQIGSFSAAPGQVEEVDRVEPLGPARTPAGAWRCRCRCRRRRRRTRGRTASESSEPKSRAPTPESPWPPDWTPASAFSISSQKTTHGAIASTGPQGLADSLLGLARPASPSARRRRAPASAGRSRCPSALANSDLARARHAQQEDAAGPGPGGPARPQGPRAEGLEGLQPAEVGERLAAPVQGQQARPS